MWWHPPRRMGELWLAEEGAPVSIEQISQKEMENPPRDKGVISGRQEFTVVLPGGWYGEETSSGGPMRYWARFFR